MSNSSPRVGHGPLRVMLLGGGSGGHVLPGLAVAESLGGEATCFAVCSDRPIDARILEDAGCPFRPLPARPPGRGPRSASRFIRGSWTSLREGRRLLREQHTEVVLATGGFVCPPVAAAARTIGVPIVALSLDVVPGRAIRFVGRLASRHLAGGPVAGGSSRWRSAVVTGVPIRRSALATNPPSACRRELGLDPERPTLLITGASQGARTLDELALRLGASEDRPLAGWQVLHLTGGGDAAASRVAESWRKLGVPAVAYAFLDRMGLAWGAATLALSRAGAGSVAEAAGNRVPSVFLPYPWHADAHQKRNAEPLAAAGGAVIRPDHIDGDRNLADAGRILQDLLVDEPAIDRMRTALSACPGGTSAAASVADELRRLVPR